MGDLGNNYTDNLGMEAEYTYGVSDLFGFNANLGYSDHSDGKFSMTSFSTGLRTNLSWYDRVIPYVVIGLGFYRPDIQISETQSISPITFGMHLGGGIDLQITKQMFFGAGLTFHDMFSTTNMNPVTGQNMSISGTYTTFLVHAGMSI